MIELSCNSENPATKLTWLQRRTRLEKKLLVVSLVVGVLLITFFIDACITSDDSSNACETYDCIMAASQIINQVDQSVKPCDDFFKFACGKITERTHHKNIPTAMLQTQVKQQLQNILNEPVKEDDHQALKDEKTLFQACLSQQESGISLDVTKSILHELNGWPVLMGNTWNENYFHWPETIIKIKEMGLQQSMFFRTYLDEEQNSTTKLITITPLQRFDLEDKHMYAYKNFLKSSAMLFGVNETYASAEMGEVLKFVVQLDKIENAEYNSEVNITQEKITLADFQGRYPQVNWISYFNAVLHPNNISIEQYVKLPHSKYIDALFDLLNTTSKRTIANFLVWNAILELMPVSSDSYLVIHNRLGCLHEYSKLDTVTACRRAMSQIFSPRPSDIIFASKYVAENTRKKVKVVFHKILTEFKHVLETTTWLNSKTHKNISDWVNNITVLIAAPEGGLNAVYNKYKKPDNMHKPFIKIYLEAKRKNHLNKDSAWFKKQRFLHYLVPKTEIMYLIPDHTIMIPSGFLQGLYFNPKWPMYLNFGGLGKAIATALSLQLITGLKLNNNGVWSTEIQNIFENITNCITHNSTEFKWFQYTPDNYLNKRIKLAEIVGIKLAYQAYKKWILNHEQDRLLLGNDYTADQLFWIWTFTNACYDDSEIPSINFYSDSEVIRHNYYFGDDFNCKPDSKMNPLNKCIIF